MNIEQELRDVKKRQSMLQDKIQIQQAVLKVLEQQYTDSCRYEEYLKAKKR